MKIDQETYYNRQVLLPEIGFEGQRKLSDARVVVIGAGGLGSPVLEYLCRAGVGKIGIVDFDDVHQTNLHRQSLYTTVDIGKRKVGCAQTRLQEVNPFVDVLTHPARISPDNILDIIRDYDIVVDCTDNYPTRYLINDACVLSGKPLVSGAIYRFEGQVTVFNYENGPTYRCLFPNFPTESSKTNCSTAGVIGTLPGFVGILQANEVIKIILRLGDVLSGKILLINALTLNTRTLEFGKTDSFNYQSVLKDSILTHAFYDAICDTDESTINLGELEGLIQKDPSLALIDVREIGETPIWNYHNVFQLPMSTLNIDQLPQAKTLVVFCKSGMRSAKVCTDLKTQIETKNIYNIGGITPELIELWEKFQQQKIALDQEPSMQDS